VSESLSKTEKMCRPPEGGEDSQKQRTRIAAREFFRCILESNDDVVLCEASATLGLEFATPNCRAYGDSVLGLVAPESRGKLAKAIFQSGRDRVTRARVRSWDGRLADALVLCEEPSRRPDDDDDGTSTSSSKDRRGEITGLPGGGKKKDPPYVVGLFSVQPQTTKGRGGQVWTEEACRKAAEVGSKLTLTTSFCAAVDVDETGAVAAAAGLVVPRRVNPIDLIADRDRRRVVETFARAKASGHTVSSAIHDMTDVGRVLTTCAFRPSGGALLFVYACSTDDDQIDDDDDDTLNASFSRNLSLDDVREDERGSPQGGSSTSPSSYSSGRRSGVASSSSAADPHSRGGASTSTWNTSSSSSQKTPPTTFRPPPSSSVVNHSSSSSQKNKRKRQPSAVAIGGATFDERALAAAAGRTSAAAAKGERERGRGAASSPSSSDDEWGHFVFPDGDGVDLPPVPLVGHPPPDAVAQPKRNASGERRQRPPGGRRRPRPPQSDDDDDGDVVVHDVQYDDDERPAQRPFPLIDLDSVLPRQQSIEKYEASLRSYEAKSLTATRDTVAPTTREETPWTPPPPQPYDGAQLDSLLDAVLPRPESLVAFRDTMREYTTSTSRRENLDGDLVLGDHGGERIPRDDDVVLDDVLDDDVLDDDDDDDAFAGATLAAPQNDGGDDLDAAAVGLDLDNQRGDELDRPAPTTPPQPRLKIVG